MSIDSVTQARPASGAAVTEVGQMRATKQVLVVYYSLTGHTAKVAKDLAARLDADVESIDDTQHGPGWLGQLTASFHAWRRAPTTIGAIQRDPSKYRVTLIGTPVWAWQMTPAVRTYLQKTNGKLRKVAFFVTSGNTDVTKIVPSLEILANCKAVASAGFNARELADPSTYDRKLSDFVERVKRTSPLTSPLRAVR